MQELAKVNEQLKSSNEMRFKLKAKLEDALASKNAVEETAQTEQQRLSFALEEMRAEMEVLKAIYQDELDAAKKAAAEQTRTATSQLGEQVIFPPQFKTANPQVLTLGVQAEDALLRLSSAQTKLEAAERRLESLGVDAVSLQVRRGAAASAAVVHSRCRSASTRWSWRRKTSSSPLVSESRLQLSACRRCVTPPTTLSSKRSSATSRHVTPSLAFLTLTSLTCSLSAWLSGLSRPTSSKHLLALLYHLLHMLFRAHLQKPSRRHSPPPSPPFRPPPDPPNRPLHLHTLLPQPHLQHTLVYRPCPLRHRAMRPQSPPRQLCFHPPAITSGARWARAAALEPLCSARRCVFSCARTA